MSRLRANQITNKTANGAPTATNGFIVTGVCTATTFKGTTGTFSGNLGVGGVLTYEDVANIDSVGIITARTDVLVGSTIKLGASSGIITATSFRGDASQMTGAGLGTDGSGFAGNDENDSATDSYTNHRGTVVAFRDENRGLKNVYRAQIGGTTYGTQASNTGTGDLDELYCNHTSATVSDLYGGCGVPNSKDEIAATIEKELWLMELAYHKGPVKFQTEWAHAVYDARHPAHDTVVGGGIDAKYYQLTYNITGESWAKAYNKGGKYKGIKPGQNWSKGSGGGAWQVAFRHSTYDAEDVKINGGTSSHWGSRLQGSNAGKTQTIGLNWILNPNVKFMFNYADTDYDFPIERLNGDDKIQGDRTTSDSQVMSARLKMSF